MMASPDVVHCDEVPWVNEDLKCTVVGYGDGYELSVDMGDSSGSAYTYDGPGTIMMLSTLMLKLIKSRQKRGH